MALHPIALGDALRVIDAGLPNAIQYLTQAVTVVPAPVPPLPPVGT